MRRRWFRFTKPVTSLFLATLVGGLGGACSASRGTPQTDAVDLDARPSRSAAHKPPLASVDSTERAPVHDEAVPSSQLLESALSQFALHRSNSGAFRPSFRRTNRQELASLLTREVVNQQPETVATELDELLIAWGLLPTGFRSQQAIVERLKQEPHSVYLVTLRQIAVPIELPEAALPSSVLHEVVHAYQDERYHLGEQLSYRPGKSDRISAYHAFAEGEALQVELLAQVSSGQSRLPTTEELRPLFTDAIERTGLPRIVARSLVAPYLDGYRFVAYLRASGGFKLVDRVWSRGLGSTQELLHPERWVSQCVENACQPIAEPPLLPSPNPVSTGSRVSYEDSFGEQGLRILLEETESESDARRLSAEYRRDRLSIFRQDAARDVAWQLELASDEATKELCTALATILSPNRPTVPLRGCVNNDRAVLAMYCSGRDILVASHIQADTWAANARAGTCVPLRRWLRSGWATRPSTN